MRLAAGDVRIWNYVLVEGGLALVGMALAWAAGFDALARPSGAEELIWAGPIAWGVGSGLAFFGIMTLLEQAPWEPIDHLRELVEEALGRLLRDVSLLQVAALSLAAGVGEEVLFRGFLQQGIADALGRQEFSPLVAQTAAIGVTSLVFGLCHAISKLYLVAAGATGALLGWLYLATDSLLAPIAAHAVYDFAVILLFLRSRRAT